MNETIIKVVDQICLAAIIITSIICVYKATRGLMNDQPFQSINEIPDQLLDVHAICEQRDQAVAERDELKAELAAANQYNDTDKPLSEVMAAIDDAVLLIYPDVESNSAGTIINRVETAAELARGPSVDLLNYLAALQSARALIEEIAVALRQECGQFNFPDEDRPIIWSALQRAEQFLNGKTEC